MLVDTEDGCSEPGPTLQDRELCLLYLLIEVVYLARNIILCIAGVKSSYFKSKTELVYDIIHLRAIFKDCLHRGKGVFKPMHYVKNNVYNIKSVFYLSPFLMLYTRNGVPCLPYPVTKTPLISMVLLLTIFSFGSMKVLNVQL